MMKSNHEQEENNMFNTSPNRGMYKHLNTTEELEAEMVKINEAYDEANKVPGMAGVAKMLVLKVKTEQIGWRYGEITGIDFMNA